MTSGLVLDEFNLDLSPSGLLVLGSVLVVLFVLAAVGGIWIVDEAIVIGDGGVVYFVTDALVGHVWGRDVGGLGHGLGRDVGGNGWRELLRIRRGNLRVWNGLDWLASAKGHELVKRTGGEGRVGGRAPPIRTRTGKGEEL